MFGAFGKRPLALSVLLALGGLGALLPQGARAEDTAVVVGINEYPHLEDGNLNGCVADAESMKETLAKRGFKIVMLTNGAATKNGILKTLQGLKSRVHSGDRFVFYFAGHGSHDTSYQCVLLAADAEESNFDHTLNKEELAQAIAEVPTEKRTILLDACHSEGLFRSRGLPKFRSRYHRLRINGAKSKRLPNVNQTDNNDNIIDKGFCGFAACLRNQPAGELEFEGVTHGIFTHYLTEKLNTMGSDASWDEVVTQVSASVAETMEQQQTPVFGPNVYRPHKVFDGKDDKKPDPNPHPGPRTLWEDYVDNKANPRYVKVMVDPDKSAFQIGDKFDVNIEAGAEGYLVVLNKDNSGKIYLFSPDPTKGASVDEMVDAARVTAGTTRTIHTQGVDKGTERVKAILFHSESEARGLIAKFPKDGATESELRRSRRLPNNGESGDWTYYTSVVQVDILNGTKNDNDDTGLAPPSTALQALLRTGRPSQAPVAIAPERPVAPCADPSRLSPLGRKGDPHA